MRSSVKFNHLNFESYDLKLLLDEEEAKKIDGRLLSSIEFENIKNIMYNNFIIYKPPLI